MKALLFLDAEGWEDFEDSVPVREWFLAHLQYRDNHTIRFNTWEERKHLDCWEGTLIDDEWKAYCIILEE